MNLRKIWIFRIGLLFILFIFGPPLLLADNCSAPSDCFPTLAAAAAAAAAAGALAGWILVGKRRDLTRDLPDASGAPSGGVVAGRQPPDAYPDVLDPDVGSAPPDSEGT